MLAEVIHPFAVIRPASSIDAAHGWRWVVRATPARSAITLARFEQRRSAEAFVAVVTDDAADTASDDPTG